MPRAWNVKCVKWKRIFNLRFAPFRKIYFGTETKGGQSPTPSRIFPRWRRNLYARKQTTSLMFYVAGVKGKLELQIEFSSSQNSCETEYDEAVRRRNWMKIAMKLEFHAGGSCLARFNYGLHRNWFELHGSDCCCGDKSFCLPLSGHDRSDSCQFMEIKFLRRLSMAWISFIRHSGCEVTCSLTRFRRASVRLG